MEDFSYTDLLPDWHDTYSIQLGELMAEGFDPYGSEQWADVDWYSDEQRERFQAKFALHYKYQELGVTPPLVWRDMLTAKMLEVMPKYKPIYAKLAAGADILGESDEWLKSRSVYSDFPATQIAPDNQDYASNASDNEYERVRQGSWMDSLERLRSYNDVDVMLIDECATLFSQVASVSAPW